jgi:phage shock protein PspC (stress-responsive transcriptional regulator)
MEKKIYRSRENKILTGVCGGLAEYFELDVNLVRVLTVVLGAMFTFVTVAAYIAAALLFPEKGAEE